MQNPTAAMLVIGDEILSGRTQDTNKQYLAAALTDAGVDLKEARVVSDDADAMEYVGDTSGGICFISGAAKGVKVVSKKP